jgi:hypothetical protein
VELWRKKYERVQKVESVRRIELKKECRLLEDSVSTLGFFGAQGLRQRRQDSG